MKGLIIKPNWAELILNGSKDIEIRGSNTNIRGNIGIIESGTKKVYGEVVLYDCKKINKYDFENLQNRHKLNMSYEDLLNIYPNPHGWFLNNVIKYKEPKKYTHKKGCVIWVNI